VHKQALSLRDKGYDVVLVVKHPEVVEYLGMPVIAANSRFGTKLRPLLNLPSWFLQCRQLNGDVYIVRNPDTIPLAFLLILSGRKVIYDTHEDFSKRPLIRQISPAFLKPFVARLITYFERLLARFVSAMIVTQPQQVQSLGGKTFLQPNAPLTDGPIFDAARANMRHPNPDSLTMIYVGEITEDRGLWTMLNLIESVNERVACRLSLVGWFNSSALHARAKQHSAWKHVDFSGRLTHAEALSRITGANVALALLKPVADYPTSSITKLFEYMQFGVPFVASNFNAWRVTTDRGEPGLYTDPTSSDECLAACMRLLEDRSLNKRMGDAGAHYIASEFNWSLIVPQFLRAVQSACEQGKTGCTVESR
jgi:glycosyltransferase involved in cell wall biosynthesis